MWVGLCMSHDVGGVRNHMTTTMYVDSFHLLYVV